MGTIDYSFEARRLNKFTDSLYAFMKGFRGIKPDLDLCGRQIHVTGAVFGKKGAEELRLIIYDTCGEFAHAMGAMRFDKPQWEKIVAYGNAILAAHDAAITKPNEPAAPL